MEKIDKEPIKMMVKDFVLKNVVINITPLSVIFVNKNA